MNKIQLSCLMSLAIIAATLSACGQQTGSPAAALTTTTTTTTNTASSDPSSDFIQTPEATESVEPTPAPPVDVATPSASASPGASTRPTPSALPSFLPTPHPVMGDAIVQNVQKSTTGILIWKKSRITFQLSNPLQMRKSLKERLVVTFTLKGAVVEVVETQVQLSVAQIKVYTFESTKHADEASAVTYLN